MKSTEEYVWEILKGWHDASLGMIVDSKNEEIATAAIARLRILTPI